MRGIRIRRGRVSAVTGKRCRSSLHFRVEYAAIIAHDLRKARAQAIATARIVSSGSSGISDRPSGPHTPLKNSRSDGPGCWRRSFARESRAWKGAGATRSELLARAEPIARSASMHMHLAACQYRRGTLTAGSPGQELLSEAEAWLREQKIVNPIPLFRRSPARRLGELIDDRSRLFLRFLERGLHLLADVSIVLRQLSFSSSSVKDPGTARLDEALLELDVEPMLAVGDAPRVSGSRDSPMQERAGC